MSETEGNGKMKLQEVDMQQDVIVIGISGASCSGKSTVSHELHSELGGKTRCALLCQDTAFDVHKIYEQLGGNWEAPEALDHDRFHEQVIAAIRAGHETLSVKGKGCQPPSPFYVILEGFLLFHDERLVRLMHLRVWLEIDKDLCYQRRMATKSVPEDYFHSKLWPQHVEYRRRVMGSQPLKESLLVLKGTATKERLISCLMDQSRAFEQKPFFAVGLASVQTPEERVNSASSSA
uniref:Phosphoribulokinase/uridine kinase domain-containing protein n=1 Tax=Chromera velia CCMP2878 TaxID=1169474 RepID=A0A0G4HR32_9ALVE|eukprot:Cvel_8074.t1-p1 / transcript=Cvel_8074.t1 / gene=Cvel_8074 / organism=Chromera_velia_CCMP2878 / gene_product=Uridine kinase, putative / transcript_product=Uridine kinase, putative / location=Cvel_scaffold437:86159-86860(-) / protein_length=234 / sequence_SO=supercontig / SO=protein_coding / is_pseudo=false